MMNKKLEAEKLIDRYLSGNCSEEERLLIARIYNQSALKRSVGDQPIDFDQKGQESWKQIYSVIQKKPASVNKLWARIAAAAAVLIFVAAGLWFYSASRPGVNSESGVVYQNDIAPGKNTAILILSNGKTIRLSDAKRGVVLSGSKLTYNDGSEVIPQAGLSPQSYTLSTPKGGQYQVTLPDGTEVWLNAESTLSFSMMQGKHSKRNVMLIGEAYFEVAKDKHHPFVVKTKEQEVTVLGTHFNINGYGDNLLIKTTLLEGSIQVSAGKGIEIIKPGEQALVAPGKPVNVQRANVKEAVAWKNGYFHFRAERIDQIMLQLSRWYNIEVVYEGTIPEERFNGNISRYKNISEVLNMLSYAKAVKFKVNGRRVTVMQ